MITAPTTDAEGRRAAKRYRQAAWPLVVCAVVLFLTATQITHALAEVMPASFQVRSAGTFYPPFAEAFPTVLRGLAIATVAAIGLAPLVARLEFDDRGYVVVLGVLAVVTAVFYGWLAYPHNGFPTNSRIHWVDIFFHRADDFYYTLVKLPHVVFYGTPWLLQAINGALNVVLTATVTRRLTGRRAVALAAGASYMVSSQFLTFADSAEDVQLSVTALLVVALAYVTRRPVAMGLAMVLAVLARPTFLLVLPALGLAEMLTAAQPGASLGARISSALRNRFMWVSFATFALVFGAWTAWQHVFADPWLLTGGRIVDRHTLGTTPAEIDGYTISPYGGAYVGHVMWLVPLPMWAAIAFVVVRSRRLDERGRRFLLFAGSFVVATVLMNETIVVLYYNVRYATYVLPFLLLLAWLASTVIRDRNQLFVAAGALLLVGAMTSPPHTEFGVRDRVQSDPIAQAAPDGHELRQLADDQVIATTFSSTGDINYLAYLFRRSLSSFVELEEGEQPPEDAIVVTAERDAYPGMVLYESEGFYVLQLE